MEQRSTVEKLSMLHPRISRRFRPILEKVAVRHSAFAVGEWTLDFPVYVIVSLTQDLYFSLRAPAL